MLQCFIYLAVAMVNLSCGTFKRGGVLPELLVFVAYCLKLYMWVFVLDALLSWLVSFNVLNTSSQVVYVVGTALQRLTRPVLAPIRRYTPDLGGIDISPIIAILGLVFIRDVVVLGWLMRPFFS